MDLATGARFLFHCGSCGRAAWGYHRVLWEQYRRDPDSCLLESAPPNDTGFVQAVRRVVRHYPTRPDHHRLVRTLPVSVNQMSYGVVPFSSFLETFDNMLK